MSNILKSQHEEELSGKTLHRRLEERRLLDLLVEIEEYLDCYGSSWMLDKVREALAPYGELK